VAGCQHATVEPSAEPANLDLNSQLQVAKAKLADLLPQDMTISTAEISELPEGRGILFHSSPKDGDKAHPSFALFLWPNANPKGIAYETGKGAHTFRPIGDSEEFRIYYSGPSGFMKKEIVQAFCTKNTE
jgi:hypothetical protein